MENVKTFCRRNVSSKLGHSVEAYNCNVIISNNVLKLKLSIEVDIAEHFQRPNMLLRVLLRRHLSHLMAKSEQHDEEEC